MDKKVKSFWLYTIILFTSAFILVLFSALSGTRLQEEKTETQKMYHGAQSSLIELTKQNETVLAENSELKKSVDELLMRVDELSAEAAGAHAKSMTLSASIEALLEAETLIGSGEYIDAAAALEKVDQSLLDSRALSLYTKLKKQSER